MSNTIKYRNTVFYKSTYGDILYNPKIHFFTWAKTLHVARGGKAQKIGTWVHYLAASQRHIAAGWRPKSGPRVPAFWVVSPLSRGVQKYMS
jgi:hypothetical protein